MGESHKGRIFRRSGLTVFRLVGVCALSLNLGFGFTSSKSTKLADAPIRIQIGGEPGTLDPVMAIDSYAFGIMRNVNEGLFILDGKGVLQNGLAASYQISKDALTYRFKLRPDARWSDGKPVTIDDFIYGWSHAIDHNTGSQNAEFLFAIKGSRDAFNGKKPLHLMGLSKVGDELVVELEKPDPAFLSELTLPVASPLRRDIYEANHRRWNFHFPTTGPFKITAYDPSEKVELDPNSYNEKPGKRKILFRILPEEVTAMNLFESGYLDVISTVTPTEMPNLRKEGLIQTFPSTTVYYFSFNVMKPPFNDPAWRKAVAGSVDREGLTKALGGMFVASKSYLPETIDGFLPIDDSFQPEVEKIKALKDKPRIELAYGSSVFGRTATEKLQQDLKKKLGLEMTLVPMELKMLLGRLQADPPNMYLLGMSALFNDPMNQFNAFANTSSENFTRYKNPAYEKLTGQITTTSPGPARVDEIHEAQRLLIEKDTVMIPMVLRLQVFGVSKSLKGFQVNPYQVIQLNQLEK
jgi:oligopeptide transport system substrate-binding protein